jgi:hypothetical protein
VDWLVVVGERVQLEAVKLPLLLEPKLTVPEGALAVPTSMSLTVAVQLVGASSGTLPGVQLTLVEVARLVTTTVVVPLLVRCLASPP